MTKCTLVSMLKQIFQFLNFLLVRAKGIKLVSDVIPQIHSKDSTLTNHLVKKKGLGNCQFSPPLILLNGYVQTIAGMFYKPLQEFRFQREYLQMSDKGAVALDWFIQSTEKLKRTSPILVIFPRLTGDALSVGSICKLGVSKGMRPVVFNRRGYGSSLLFTPHLTSIGDTRDTRRVLEYIQCKFPLGKIIGIGIGAGCTSLFSYLGEFGSSSLMKAAVNISPSYDNTVGGRHIPKLYELLLLLHLKFHLILKNWKALCNSIDIKEVLVKSWTLKKFDYLVYCKRCGEESFDSFCQRNDPMRDVDDIAVPVLCINSYDDPVSVKENIPFDIFDFYPNLILVTVDKGGHCAFFENLKDDSWVDGLAIQYIQHVLEFVSNSKNR